MTIGFIGLGAMGGPMARRLRSGGYSVIVHDVNSHAVEQLVSLGATAGDTPAAIAAASEVLITMLPDSPDVQAVVSGKDGVLEGLQPGMVLIEMSTIDPAVTLELAGMVGSAGGHMLDAPCGRTSSHAEQGSLFIMVGGDEAIFRETLPVLAQMGSDVVFCGPSGSGATMKLVNNLLTTTIVAANAEALALGVKAGLKLETIVEVLGSTAASNSHLTTTYPAQALSGNLAPGFATRLAYKDLGLAMQLAGRHRMPVSLGASALQLFAMARSLGHDDDDYTAVLRVLEQYAGHELRLSGTA